MPPRLVVLPPPMRYHRQSGHSLDGSWAKTTAGFLKEDLWTDHKEREAIVHNGA